MGIIAALVLSTGMLTPGGASAQVLLCPEVPPASMAVEDMPLEAERLLKRLTIALDLHGHRGISEDAILEEHVETPSALLGKLDDVASRCANAGGDVEAFHEALPELRKLFLQATDLQAPAAEDSDDPAIKSAAHTAEEAQRVERSIDLSVRELWRKLWFRSPQDSGDGDRWAVIVASPPNGDAGWDKLGDYQRRWKDAYFQLHEPYYDNNPHHAIVVGRRLPRDQAVRLRDYVIKLGMAGDSYIWPLPVEDEMTTEE